LNSFAVTLLIKTFEFSKVVQKRIWRKVACIYHSLFLCEYQSERAKSIYICQSYRQYRSCTCR